MRIRINEKDFVFGIFMSTMMAFLALIIVWGGFQTVSDDGHEKVVVATVQNIEVAYLAERYGEVRRLYDSPMAIRFMPDLSLSEQPSYVPPHVQLMLADSLARLGYTDRAASVYIDILGWDESQYEAFCMLGGDCENLNALHAAARNKARVEGPG